MKLKQKIWLWLVAVIGVILVIDLGVSYVKLRDELRVEQEFDARTVYGFMMATRRIYQEQFVASGLPVNTKTVGFLPAHSFSRIAADFANWNDSGIIFNNVSDQPRNEKNRADRDELVAMDWFRANPKAHERMDNVADAKGNKYLLYTAPIWIEPFCLKCHGSREDAPESIRENYAGAYGYQEGDLRGVVSIKIPFDKFERRFGDIWAVQAIKSMAGYLVLLLTVGILLDRLVTRRLARLQSFAGQVATGQYDTSFERASADEICDLGEAFNQMGNQVRSREQMLGKLSLAIEQSPESVIITDLEGNIEYVNDCFTRKTGYTRDEVLGHNPRFLQSGKTPPQVYADMWAALRAGHAWQGEFINRRKDGTEYIEAINISPVRKADGTITSYLAVKQDITDKKLAQERIDHLAYYDPLTNLPNRTLLMDRLELSLAVAQRQRQNNALILINLDRFKNLNEAHGHTLGDLLLIAFGGRLIALLREVDTLARLGGDEFAILLLNLGSQREIASRRVLAIVEKIHESMQLPFCLDADKDTVVTVSIGITLSPEGKNDRAAEVLRRADTALHRAKEAGGNQSAFFESDMGQRAQQRFTIERDLRRAIAGDELRLYLQSQVDATGKVIAAEALVRWQHPERGLVPPSVFIGIAEESELIVDLGGWVLSEACALIARETMAGYPLRLSVNLSPRQFRQNGFVPWLKDMLSATGADPALLTLEVTEGLVIENIDAVVAKMSELTALGIHFSVDDFGTGYSSLAYLKRMPIHELKIDKSFVQDAPQDLNDAALVETILSIARHLHLQVVAEGVETQAQMEFLNARGNIIHQGYLHGKPEPAEHWIARWRSLQA